MWYKHWLKHTSKMNRLKGIKVDRSYQLSKMKTLLFVAWIKRSVHNSEEVNETTKSQKRQETRAPPTKKNPQNERYTSLTEKACNDLVLGHLVQSKFFSFEQSIDWHWANELDLIY